DHEENEAVYQGEAQGQAEGDKVCEGAQEGSQAGTGEGQRASPESARARGAWQQGRAREVPRRGARARGRGHRYDRRPAAHRVEPATITFAGGGGRCQREVRRPNETDRGDLECAEQEQGQGIRRQARYVLVAAAARHGEVERSRLAWSS